MLIKIFTCSYFTNWYDLYTWYANTNMKANFIVWILDIYVYNVVKFQGILGGDDDCLLVEPLKLVLVFIYQARLNVIYSAKLS